MNESGRASARTPGLSFHRLNNSLAVGDNPIFRGAFSMDDLICCSLRQSEILKAKLEWKLERAMAASLLKQQCLLNSPGCISIC